MLRGELTRRGMWARRMIDYRSGRVVTLGSDKGVMMQWLLANYSTQVGIDIFTTQGQELLFPD